MSYATEQDLVERAGEVEILQLADRDGSGAADPTVIAAALAHADGVIDGYLAAKYALPLASVPELLTAWAVSIARYVLHRDGAPEHVATDYKDAIAALKDVARGLLALPEAAGAAPAAASGTFLSDGPAQVFTETHLRGWR